MRAWQMTENLYDVERSTWQYRESASPTQMPEKATGKGADGRRASHRS